jgi:hypothetical protein
VILRHKSPNYNCCFEAQTEKPAATVFETKPRETVLLVFRSNHLQTVLVILRSNHRQTVDLGFKAELRNSRFSSPRARCRPRTAFPDLSIVRPPSTQHVQPSPILYTRSPTPDMILVTARHATPVICTQRDKQP